MPLLSHHSLPPHMLPSSAVHHYFRHMLSQHQTTSRSKMLRKLRDCRQSLSPNLPAPAPRSIPNIPSREERRGIIAIQQEAEAVDSSNSIKSSKPVQIQLAKSSSQISGKYGMDVACKTRATTGGKPCHLAPAYQTESTHPSRLLHLTSRHKPPSHPHPRCGNGDAATTTKA